jgi:uncharacterized membrane protein (UPF0127 family)
MRHLTFAAIVLTLACGGPATRAQSALPGGHVVFPDGTKVAVEIAATDPVRMRGLMFRQYLAENEGMIFVFPKVGFYPFWMKDTLIPLDMLWLDADGRIVSIARSVPPCRADPCPEYSPRAEALYVVELRSGFARRHGVKTGDPLALQGIPKQGR